MSDVIGKTFGKYEVVAPLGRGGMAEVYKAYQPNLERHVALKLVLAHLAEADPEFIGRFEREAKSIAALRHPNIVQVYDYDVQGDTPYMVMELIEGGTLKSLLDDRAKRRDLLPLTEATRVTRSIGEALAYAHKRGMIHRDVKPANVMFDAEQRVILTDFGLAKLITTPAQTATGQTLGTPAYMAPEQGLGQPGDPRSDLYSLGVMLFEMMTGRLPYHADTAMALILQHIHAPTPRARALRPDLPEALDAFIFRVMAKEPKDRFPNMEAFLLGLREAESGHLITSSFSNSLTPILTPSGRPEAPEGMPASTPPPGAFVSQTPPEPTLPPDVSSFVGRQAQLTALGQQLAQTHLVVLSGMPGIGKTALAAALARRVNEPALIFWHSFHAGEDVSTLVWKLSAFLAWRRRPDVWNMLDSARQTRSQSAPPEVIIDYVFQLMRGQGYLLCLDDIHHIDDDPLFEHFLERLQAARRAGEVTVLLTTRRVSRALEEDVTTPVPGLTAADAESLLQARGLALAPDLLDTLHQHTEGNPQLLSLAVEALRRAKSAARLLDDLLETPRIGDFLMKEVDKGLDSDEREVMKGVAALLGYPGTRSAVYAVLGDDTPINIRRTLNDLVGRYLLMVLEGEVGREYDEHALVQAYYYDLLTKKERTEWHRRAAEYYETEEPDRLKAARHYQKAGQDEKAADLAIADVWAFINQGQTRAVRQVLEALTERKLSPPAWVRVLLARGQVYALLGEAALARTSYEAAYALLAQSPSMPDGPELHARACRGLGELLQADQPEEALHWLKRGLDSLPDGAVTEQRAALLIRQGRILALLGHSDESVSALQEGLRALPPGPSRLRLSALGNLGNIYCIQGQTELGLRHYRQVLDTARQLNDFWAMGEVWINLGIELDVAARWPEALENYQLALQQADRLGSLDMRLRSILGIGNTQHKLGDDTAARRSLSDCQELAHAAQSAYVELCAGISLAGVLASVGESAAALPLLADMQRLAEQTGLREPVPELLYVRALAQLANDGERPEALASAEAALALARELQAVGYVGVSQRVLGQVQWADGQPEAAIASFEQSLAVLAGHDPYEAARTQAEWGRALVASGQTEPGRRLLAEARATFERLGARRELAALG